MKTLKQIREASGGKEAYQKFFNSLLKKFGVDSPSELDDKKKKEFFNAVDKGWDGGDEPKEKGESIVKEAKIKAGKGKAKLDIDYETPDDYDSAYGKKADKEFVKDMKKKFKIAIKVTRMGADISGKKSDLLKFLQSDLYGMDDMDIEDLFPELLESINEDAPPGMEDVVKKLKADGNSDEEAFAIAWSAYNNKKRRERNYYDEAARIPTKLYNQVLRIAMHNSGDMEKAIKQIERLKKGLSDHKDVMNILKIANESVSINESDIHLPSGKIKLIPKSKWSAIKKKYNVTVDPRDPEWVAGHPNDLYKWATDKKGLGMSKNDVQKKYKHITPEYKGASLIKNKQREGVNEGVNIKALAKQFRKNEDENRHSENYLMLAKAFGTSREVREVESIIKRSKIQGHTDHKDIKWMFQNIGKYFHKVRQGEEVNLDEFTTERGKKVRWDTKRGGWLDMKGKRVYLGIGDTNKLMAKDLKRLKKTGDWSTPMDLTKEEVEEGKIYPVMDQGQRKKIIKIANKHSGDMEKAIKQIEKLKKGITDNPAVMDILRKANESKDNEVKQESKKYHETKPGSLQDAVGQVLKVEG